MEHILGLRDSLLQMKTLNRFTLKSGKNILKASDAECYYLPNFITDSGIFQKLENEIIYRQESIRMFGKFILEPRTKALVGDEGVVVTYSGSSMKAMPWTPTLCRIKYTLEHETGYSFNCCLLNRYDDGNQYMGYHRDNEQQNDRSTPIVSLSFGAERDFLFRRYASKRRQEPLKIKLESGSLLVMMPNSFETFEHSLPKRLRVTQPRINLTFRQVLQ